VKRKIKPIGSVHFPGQTNLKHTKLSYSALTQATEAGMFFSDDKDRSPNALSKIHWRTCEPISLRAREGNPEDRVIGVEKYSRSGALNGTAFQRKEAKRTVLHSYSIPVEVVFD